MEQYEKPSMEIIELTNSDIITESCDARMPEVGG